jgi:hypothetical protein
MQKSKPGMAFALRQRMKLRTARALVWTSLPLVALACSGSVTTAPSAAIDDAGGAAGNTLGGVAGNARGGAAGGTHAPHGIPVCESPSFDATSQLVVCANGFAHRAQPSVCSVQPGASDGGAAGESGTPEAGAAGTSSTDPGSYGLPCAQDGDCASGAACVCNPLAYLPDTSSVRSGTGACVLATCKTDADCGAGAYCAVGALEYLGDTVPGFGCLRADDECTTDADCDSSNGQICLERTKRTCSQPPE